MIVLKPFQQVATDAATDILVGGRPDSLEIGRIATPPDRRAVLIEAPTGSGKTIMAATVVALCGRKQKVLWMWFAPFAGVTDQSAEVIALQFGDLRVRNLQNDRDVEAIRANDIYVTTWGAVAARNAESRVVRTPSESMASIDQVIEEARRRGFLIGAVVDEAHHGFVKAAQAKRFFTKTLSPDLTILVTATPNDRDIEVFRHEADLGSIARVSVSRADAVAAGLIKPGVRAVSFTRAPNSGATPIDFERTALRYGVDTHNHIKRALGQNRFEVTPLMLVQVESGDDSVSRARQTLIDFGIPESAIATHTSDEPDPDILALAHDEQVQVLIFKMAVALGFDAPRAWTLVSMRSSQDVDFGVQIVGRVLRVDRRLQGRAVPEALRYAYVFVADPDVQRGLLSAAEQINRLRTDITRVATQTTMVLVQVGDDGLVPARISPDSDVSNMSLAGADARVAQPWQTVQVPAHGEVDLFGFQSSSMAASGDSSSGSVGAPIGALVETPVYRYELRASLILPTHLLQERFPRDDTKLAGCVGDRIRFDAEALHALQREGVFVVRREIDVFAPDAPAAEPTRVAGEMDMRRIILQGQTALFEDDYVGGHSLLPELVKRFAAECEREGMLGWLRNKETLEQGVFRVLGSSPQLLRRALRECLSDYIELQDASALPSAVESHDPLTTSRLNIYGIVPADLNSWERDFVEMLDLDTTGTILWWHRNPPRKEWSVRVCAPGTRHDYYPDFVVGVKGRAKPDNILLVETKFGFNTNDSMAKVRADHKAYGRVLMLTREDGDWWTLQYDASRDKVVQDQRLLIGMLARF